VKEGSCQQCPMTCRSDGAVKGCRQQLSGASGTCCLIVCLPLQYATKKVVWSTHWFDCTACCRAAVCQGIHLNLQRPTGARAGHG
jgi:hypothetical protein